MTMPKKNPQRSSSASADESAFSGDMAKMGELFDLAADACNFTERDVLAKLASGEPLAAAAGLSNEMLEWLYGRAHGWAKAGHARQAERIFQSLCLASPATPDYWAGLGFCLADRAAWEEALPAFDRALAARPGWSVMHVFRLEALVHLKDWPRAFDQYQRVQDLAPDMPHELLQQAARFKPLIVSGMAGRRGGESVA